MEITALNNTDNNNKKNNNMSINNNKSIKQNINVASFGSQRISKSGCKNMFWQTDTHQMLSAI